MKPQKRRMFSSTPESNVDTGTEQKRSRNRYEQNELQRKDTYQTTNIGPVRLSSSCAPASSSNLSDVSLFLTSILEGRPKLSSISLTPISALQTRPNIRAVSFSPTTALETRPNISGVSLSSSALGSHASLSAVDLSSSS